MTVLWLKQTGEKFLRQHVAPCGLKSNQHGAILPTELYTFMTPVYDANWELHLVLQFNVANKTDEYCEPVNQNRMINVLKEDSFAGRM